MLVGYELKLSKMLKAGSDVWLNNPRLPREASGTSGMTASMNGSINFSTYDGWIPEYSKHGVNSFVVPPVDLSLPVHQQDQLDLQNLLDILEEEILPTYYDDPGKWLSIMKNSIRHSEQVIGLANQRLNRLLRTTICLFWGATLILALALSPQAAHGEGAPPGLTGGSLETGRAVWLENCLGCHGDGTAGAPRPSRHDEWEARMAQKREVLYQHAIEGFFGPDYAMMPPRGGNEDLTDAEVMAAVDYMLGLVEYLRQKRD